MEAVYRIIINSVICLAALALGIYAFRLDPKNTLNRLVLLICIWFVERIVTLQFTFSPWLGKDEITLLFKINLFFYFTTFALNLHFFVSLKEKKKLNVWKLMLVYLPSLLALFITLNMNNLDLAYHDGAWRPVVSPPASLWPYITFCFSIYYLIAPLFFAFLFWKQSRLMREKRQAAVVFVSYFLFFAVFAVLTNGTIVKNFQVFTIFVYPMLFYVFGLCYAVFRYRFLAPAPSLVTADIIANIGDLVMLLDTRYKIITANRAAGELLALRTDALKDIDFFKLIRVNGETEKKLKDFPNESAASLRLQLPYRKKGADPVFTESYFSKVKDNFSDTVGMLVVSREIRGRKEFQSVYRLTDREMEIVDLLLAGHSNKAIGDKLSLSVRTVESHCVHIYGKVDVDNKPELFKRSARFNLIHDDE